MTIIVTTRIVNDTSKAKHHWYFATLFCLFLSTAATAAPMVPTHFSHLSVQDGLSQVTISDIAEDKIGFMWFATQNGINRFDGYNFVHYKRDRNLDGSGPIGDFVYKFAVDENSGDIWTASSSGLSRYEYKSDQFIHYPLIDSEGQPHHFVRTVVYDRTGQLWAGTNIGLFKYQKKTNSFVHIQFSNNLKFRIQDIEQDMNGVVWLATNQGVYGFKEGEALYTVAELKAVEVTDIELINQNQIWFATNGEGIYTKSDTHDPNLAVVPLTDISLELSGRSISSIKQLSTGDIWINTLDGLIITQLTDNPETVYLKHNSGAYSLLSADHMTRTFESSAGIIWQGTWTSGFSKFDPSSLQFKTLNAGNKKATRGIANDTEGNIWFGTPEGLWKRNIEGKLTGPWTFENDQNRPSPLEENGIMSIAYSNSNGTLWIGTRSGVAYLTDNQKYMKYLPNLQASIVYTLSVDDVGDLWIGDFNNGLLLIDSETHKLKSHWPMASITKILVDGEFTWASTMEGLLRVNSQTGELLDLYSAERQAPMLSPRVVTWISKSQDDYYWIGAQGSGVIKLYFDEQLQDFIFEKVVPDSHLSTLSIGGIEQDKNGNVWVSTIESIARLDASIQNPEYFSEKNGAKNEGYYINNSLTNIDGEIFFGSPSGISYFQPTDIAKSDWDPAIVFTNLSILSNSNSSQNATNKASSNKRPISQAKEIVLQPEDIMFSIEFSALDFSAPEKNQYAYKLDGFDTTWNTALSRNRVATYTNLDAGSYTLLVKGTNKDGFWSDQIGQLAITVIPPWWLTIWAKIFWSASILLILVAFYRRRVYGLKWQSHLLSIQVEDRTAELEAMNKKLLTLSTVDDLTGLRNRRDFRDKALLEIARFKRGGEPFCILLIDIDFFKQVNDINGHACGDKVLIETAQVMKSHIRQQDFLARWGGEEFIMMIVGADITQGQIVADKIRLAVAQNVVEYEGQEILISITTGVSQILPDEKLDNCINRADKNLYIGKNNGRNKVVTDR